MTYLDANATEPLRPAARRAVIEALDATGNPASVHGFGRGARKRLEDARETIAGRFAVRINDVIFTSGGTEADTLAIRGLGRGRRLLVGATEHDAVSGAAPGACVLPVDRNGVVCLETLDRMLADRSPALVCLMLANNETGTVQPVREAAGLCRRRGALLHVDAVQGPGRMEVDMAAIGAHSLAISSHKLGGPAGAGALLLGPGAPDIAPLWRGGGQERGRRGGTPSVAVIAGFAAAVRELGPDLPGSWVTRDEVDRAAAAAGAVVCGGDARRLPNTTCLALPGVRSDAQVIALDLAGFAVSAGAACSSGKIGASHVLLAMGLPELASCAIRVSLPWNADKGEVRSFIGAYAEMAARLAPRRDTHPLASHPASAHMPGDDRH